jgi:hypothetical protein
VASEWALAAAEPAAAFPEKDPEKRKKSFFFFCAFFKPKFCFYASSLSGH